MKTCERCGKEFDEDDYLNESDFNDEVGSLLSYRNVRPCLCGSCAAQAIVDEEEGIYFETCEECGCEFDYIEEKSKLYFSDGWNEGNLLDFWNESNRITCADCAMKLAEEREEEILNN